MNLHHDHEAFSELISEYCIAMSSLSEDFHKAVHYGIKILNAREYILLTDKKSPKQIKLLQSRIKSNRLSLQTMPRAQEPHCK